MAAAIDAAQAEIKQRAEKQRFNHEFDVVFIREKVVGKLAERSVTL